MRLAHLALLLCLVLPACGGGEDEAILRLDPAVHDFGRVRFGSIRVTKFRIRNTSDRDVEMILKPNCGCFKVLEGGRRSLEPGETSEFRLRFDAGAVPPQVLKGKRLDVLTDHPDGHTKIELTGEIYSLAYVEPRALRLGRLHGDASTFEPKRMKLRPADPDVKLKIVSVSVTPPDVFSVESEAADEGGHDLVVRQREQVRRPRGELNVIIDVRVEATSSNGGVEQDVVRGVVVGYWDVDTLNQKK